jgi:ATP-binding protein involved in chromosome partitioning
VPVAGSVIVTTPQDLALLDAKKGVEMFRKVNIPVLGVVENMAVHICSNCGHAEHLFGEGGGEKLAAQYGVELLASLPLSMLIREQADSGKPTAIAEPESQIAMVYQELARRWGADRVAGSRRAGDAEHHHQRRLMRHGALSETWERCPR